MNNAVITLNLTGLNCPLPVLKTKKFLAGLNKDTQILVLTDDPASKVDLKEFCTKTGHSLQNQETYDGIIHTLIKHK